MAMTPNRTRHGLVALSRVLPNAAVLALVLAYRLINFFRTNFTDASLTGGGE